MVFRKETGSILAADIGTVTTRAVLLDTVDGVYRFIARGEAPTTAKPPWNDVGEGLRAAIRDITAVTERQLLDEIENLITPEGANRAGVDNFVASASAGKPVRAILVGLMPGLSLESGRRATEDTYLRIADVISMADGRTPEQQVDAILACDPDLIIIVGGTDGGATHAMVGQIRTVAMASLLMESGNQPRILFAGNAALRDEVKTQLEEDADIEVIYADNVRPSLGLEQLDDMKAQLAEFFELSRVSGAGGFGELHRWSETGIVPTAKSFGRIVHFMGQRADWDVLGVDIGSTSSVVAASLGDALTLKVCGELGIGHSAKGVLPHIEAGHLARWLTAEFKDENDTVNYVWNKWLHPSTLPQTLEELELELALAREILRVALATAREGWGDLAAGDLLPHFGEIVASGAVLGNTPHPGYSALVILDALQPIGVTRLWLDAYGVATALGSAAKLEARAAVEVIETGGLVNLGTTVCTVGRARRGQVVLHAALTPEGEEQGESVEVRAGDLVTLPLQPGLRAQLALRPRGVDIGLPRGTRQLDVVGGALGVIIDARGRPLPIPRDAEARREAMREWRAALVESHAS